MLEMVVCVPRFLWVGIREHLAVRLSPSRGCSLKVWPGWRIPFKAVPSYGWVGRSLDPLHTSPYRIAPVSSPCGAWLPSEHRIQGPRPLFSPLASVSTHHRHPPHPANLTQEETTQRCENRAQDHGPSRRLAAHPPFIPTPLAEGAWGSGQVRALLVIGRISIPPQVR